MVAFAPAWRRERRRGGARAPSPPYRRGRKNGCVLDNPPSTGERLAVDVGGVVARQEQRHRRRSPRRRRLAAAGSAGRSSTVGATSTGPVEDRLRHAGLDQAGADRVDPDARAEERIGRGLREADDAGLARAIGMPPALARRPATEAVSTIEPWPCARS